MQELPRGTVAFLFTDIEGSTRLLQRLGHESVQVIDDHFAFLRAAVGDSGGAVVNTTGDGLFAAFASASGAVAAAIAAQRRLANHDWPSGGAIRVRMGIHLAEAEPSGGDYAGLEVHRAARICDAAHGGQILVSEQMRRIVDSAPQQDVSMRDLGVHGLKDLETPERLYQVVVADLLNDFPPPRSVDARPHNIPAEITDFVGRDDVVEDVMRRFGQSRVLTLAGPGGAGKTRLALRLAKEMLPAFDDGVFIIPLADIRDPEMLPSAISQALGMTETEGLSPFEALVAFLAPKKMLLVLDNFEQIVAAAPVLSNLLQTAPDLKMLVTSRSVLHVTGEQIFNVPSLAVPASGQDATAAALGAIESVDLFVRRARAADPDFALTDENAPAVAEIVTKLDGLPLAIELAAVGCRLFPAEALARRLSDKLGTLRDGPRDLPARHRALRDVIAWSFDLLQPEERVLFQRLGVFVSGFTLEAAEAVATGAPVESALDALAALTDNSLLQRRIVHGDPRFAMLETVREFAVEKLAEAGEAPDLAARHAVYFAHFAEESEPHLTHHGQAAMAARLGADQANLRAALAHCDGTGDTETGLRIATSIWRYWEAAGQLQEGRDWLNTFLSKKDAPAIAQAKGLSAAGGLAYWQGDHEAAIAHYQEAYGLYRDVGDELLQADTLLSMSTTCTWSGHVAEGGALADRALASFQRLGAREQVGMAFMAQGFARWMNGDLDGARPLWEESLSIAREVGNHVEAATKSIALASIMFNQGERDQALERVLAALDELAALNNVTAIIMAVDFIAAIVAHRDPERGVRLAGAASALRQALGGGMRPEKSGLAGARETAAAQVDPGTLERNWQAGQAMTFEEATAYAREVGTHLLEHAT